MKSVKYQSGRSMVEILGVLGIIAMLSVVGLLGYSYAMDRHKRNTFLHQLDNIEASIRTSFIATGLFSGLTTEIALKAGIIPSDLVQGNKIIHAYKDRVEVRVGFYSTNYFSFDIYGVPTEACEAYLSSSMNQRISHVYSPSAGKTIKVPFTRANIVDMCKGDLNTLMIAYIY